jgi:DNA polymerase-3 subunit gamma/tau
LSYQVIARKWRPKHFDELVGQNHVSQTLINALKNNRLHHALLFTGPRGTGKTSSARILAKALRCPDDLTGESPEAHDIATGRSVNVIEIDGASNNGVDAIRELRETVGYMPSTGKYKVYIIDEVHMLSTAAFNALLKTLEEPPEHVVFILATTEVQKIPNTILSRCQRFDFRRISLKLIADHLQKICTADGISASSEALWAIARQGDGSMRDSQSLLDQVVTFCGQDISADKVSEILGLTDRRLLMEALTAIIRRDPEAALAVLEKIFAAGHDPHVFAHDLLEQVRNALIAKTTKGAASQILDVAPSEIEALTELGKDLSEEDLHLLFDMMLKGLQDLSRTQEARIVFEMLLLRMVAAPRIESLLNFTRSEKKSPQIVNPGPALTTPTPKAHAPSLPAPAVSPAPKTSPAPTPAPRAQAAPVTSPTAQATPALVFNPKASPQDNWYQLVQTIKKTNGILGAQLENTFLSSMHNKVVTVGVPQRLKFLFEKMNNPAFKEQLTSALQVHWGSGHQVRLQLEDEGDMDKQMIMTPKQALEKQIREKQTEIRQSVESHPFYKSVNELFKAEIKSIKEMKS